MISSHHVTSSALQPEEARDVVISVEHLGIDTGRVEVVAEPASTQPEIGRVDRRTLARPASRAVAGALVGAVIGLVVAGIVTLATDAAWYQALPGFVVGGFAIGALVGLYSQLPLNRTVTDVDTGQLSIVRVDVAGLEQDQIDEVDRLLSQAGSAS